MSIIKGWKFPIQVDKTNGKIKTIEDNENVKQDIKIILQTQKLERKIVPNFGTDLKSFMFEIVSPPFISNVRDTITSSLKKWEKHIDDLNVSVFSNSGPISQVEVNIDYITDIEPTQERVSKDLKIN